MYSYLQSMPCIPGADLEVSKERGGFNVSISCSEFSCGRGAVLLRQLCLRDDVIVFGSVVDFVFPTSGIFF